MDNTFPVNKEGFQVSRQSSDVSGVLLPKCRKDSATH
jgi:hypothetical protein